MNKNPVILICINNLGIGGAERLVVDDVNEMCDRGLPVRLLTLKNEPTNSFSHELKIPKDQWQTINFNSIYSLSSWFRVFSYIKKEKPDKVITHLWFTNTVMRIVCKLCRISDIISFEHNIYDSVKTKKMYMIDRWLQGWCRKIVAVSSAVKQSLVVHGIDENRITVLNNGIDVSKYNVKPDTELKKSLGIPADLFVFVTIGRLIYQKGIDVLLKAFAKVSENSVLLIVGQGGDETILKSLVAELGISDRVYFLGVRNDVAQILSISDVFVLASRFEGLGIVVLEAMATGKPIIISDFEAGKDMIMNEVSGLVVKKENSEELVEAMNRMMSDSQLRTRLSQKALESVVDFSIQQHVTKLLDL